MVVFLMGMGVPPFYLYQAIMSVNLTEHPLHSLSKNQFYFTGKPILSQHVSDYNPFFIEKSSKIDMKIKEKRIVQRNCL